MKVKLLISFFLSFPTLILSAQTLRVVSVDTISLVDSLLIDKIGHINNSPGDIFLFDTDENIYLTQRVVNYKIRPILQDRFVFYSTITKFEDEVLYYGGDDVAYKIILENLKTGVQQKTKIRGNQLYITAPCATFLDGEHAYIITYYSTVNQKNKNHDYLYLRKYHKKRNKIVKDVAIDIGPEIVLGALGYQLIGHLNEMTFIAKPLSGEIMVFDENFKISDKFIVDSLIYEANQAIIADFLSDSKLKTYFRNPRRVINSFKNECPKESSVLTRILPITENEILLQYTDPVDVSNYEVFVFNRKTHQKTKLNIPNAYLRNFYSNPGLSKNGYIQTARMESDSSGNTYFVIVNFTLVHDNRIISPAKIVKCSSGLKIPSNTNSILLLDLPNYCKGCYNQDAMKNTLYLAPARLVNASGVSDVYQKNIFKANLKVKGSIEYVNEDTYQCLLKQLNPNEIYFLDD